MNDNLYIVMPAYNESRNIETTVEQWHPVVEKIGNNSKLIIFNDGSKDNTMDVMLSIQSKYSHFLPISKANSGHGSTILFAYDYCVENNADYIFQTDSDGQTDPEEFWQFWSKRKEYNFIIGSRDNRKDGFGRILINKILKFLVWIIFGENVKDLNTPFRLMNTQKLIPFLKIIPKDFFLSNVLISILVVKRKEKLLWLPISFKPRQGGINSINFKNIFKIGYRAIGDFYSVKQQIKK